MPLSKLLLKPGVNRENTRYTNEGGWYESDKVRFRQGTPEKIGGWQRISNNTFIGVCRSLWNWVTLAGKNLLGIGTDYKFYIESGGAYYDITPIRTENTLTNPFQTDTATNSGGYTTVKVTSTPGFSNGDYVTFYPALTYLSSVAITGTAGQFSCTATTLVTGQQLTISGTYGGTGSISGYASPTTYYIIATNGTTTFTLSATPGGSAITTTAGTPTGLTYGLTPIVGGVTISGEYQIAYLSGTEYNISVLGTATSNATGGGTVYAVYQITTGSATYIPTEGWGAGPWSDGTWGNGGTVVLSAAGLRIWNQMNWGQNLVYGPRGFPLYYWDANIGFTNSTVTMTVASPCVVSCSLDLADNTPITFATTGTLPTGLLPGYTYYVKYISSSSFYLSSSNTVTSMTASCVQASSLSGVTITGVAGQFACTASTITLVTGQPVVISGTYGGTGSITGYVNPTTYYIIATNGSTTFTLSATYGGAAITTTAGTPTGLTYSLSSVLTVSAITGTLSAGQTVYYTDTGGARVYLGTLTFNGSGTGSTGTYTVSTGATVSSTTMYTSLLINTSGTQSGTQSISPRGMLLSQLPGADGYTPLYQNTFTISDVNRFLLVFGTNDYGSTTLDPMLIRWSDQESLTTWYPAITNQAGSVRLSHGSKIVTTLQSRQEIVVWTDSSLYSLQYLGPPYVWGTQLLADNISIIGPNAAAMASGVSYWMGVDKFYKYDGRVQTLRCDLRQYIYSNINLQQAEQVFGSTNEGFNEVWWFYCSSNSTTVDKYVVYNYLEDNWYYGSMARTAWLDTGLRNYPLAATYSHNIVQHEYGVDDNETATTLPITATITSSQYDIGDGHNFAFVYRMIPDLTFRGSTTGTIPSVTMYLQGLNNSGSGITQSGNAGVVNNGLITTGYNVDEFTGQIYIRVRGRQMQMQITSNTIGTQWQLGAPRIDIRPDGRR